MKFIKDLHILQEKDDLSKLPEDAIKSLSKLIRDGAADLEQKWTNGIELVKKAYSVEGIELPTPAERTGYAQFEEMLALAVKELYDGRPEDKSWRMSSTVFREFKESMEKQMQISVYEIGDNFAKGHTVEVKNMEEVIEMVRKQAGKKAFDMEIEGDPAEGNCICKFSYQGIQRHYQVKIQII